MKNLVKLLILSLVMSFSLPVYAEEDELDHLALAAVLLKDGHLDRAAEILKQIDTADKKLDLIQFYRLSGLVEFKRQKYPAAAQLLSKAIEAGEEDGRIYLLRAQCLLSSGEHQKAIDAVKVHKAKLSGFTESYLLMAAAYQQLKKPQEAYIVLEEAQGRFPTHKGIAQRKLYLLIQMGLYQTAVEASRSFLQKYQATAEDSVAIAQALSKAGALEEASLQLEQTLLLFPQHKDARIQLAATYLERERPLTAAEILRPLGEQESESALHTAELYRKASRHLRAKRMNARVEDQLAKLKQRLSIFIDQENYEAAARLEPRLTRFGLLDDESIRYAVAYAFFRTGDFQTANRLLKSIQDPEIFKKSVALRRSMQACSEAQWQCE